MTFRPQEANPSFDSGGQFAWDATSLEAYMKCPRYYYYTLVKQLEPKQKSVHLIFGGLYASALEIFYTYRAQDYNIEDSLVHAIRYVLQNAEPMEHNYKNLPNLLRSIVWYADAYGEEDPNGLCTYHLSDGSAAVEVNFKFNLTEDFIYCGHLDRVVTMGKDFYVLDNKTTTQTLTPRYFDQFRPHNQFMGYTIGGQVVLHQPVRGVICDAAQVKVNGTEFARQPIRYTHEQLTEWLEGAIKTIEQARIAYSENYFPLNPASCGNYGGCAFRSICSRPKGLRENFLNSDFRPRAEPWNPLKER